MGASLKKLTPAGKEEEKGKLINYCYGKYFSDRDKDKLNDFCYFYQAVCKTVESINHKFGNTQIRIPETQELEQEYHYHGGEAMRAEDFQKILQNLVSKAGFTNAGALDSIFYILIAPATALLIKKAVHSEAVSNQVLIPGATSATVLILAALKKI